MSEKIWIKNEFEIGPEGDFVPLDGLGFLSVCYNGEGGGDMLLIDVVDAQLLQDQVYLDLLREYVNAHIGIVYRYISIMVLENGLYHDRGGIFRDVGGAFFLRLDHGWGEETISGNEVENTSVSEKDAPQTYQEKLLDPDYLESIAELVPEEFVSELGLNWEEVQARFHGARGNISRNRTDLWIKQCVLYGNEEQQDIANYTASPAKEGLVRTELAGNDMLVIIATRQSIAYTKSREVVSKGELFVWEDLRGNRKIRGKYSTPEAWKNRTALKEGKLDKRKVFFLLTMFYGLENEGQLSGITDSFTENAGYEQFTDLVRGAQAAMGDEKADGIVDAGFLASMKQVLEIEDGPDAVTVAYLAFRYLYGGLDLLGSGMPGEEFVPDFTPPADKLRVDASYTGIPLDEKPIDNRDQGSLTKIRNAIRQYLPTYAELEDNDPLLIQMVNRVFVRASTLAQKDLKSGIKEQVKQSTSSLSDRIKGLDSYFQDIQLKQLRDMVEGYTGKDKAVVRQQYQKWGELYARVIIADPDQDYSPGTYMWGIGGEYMGRDDSEIMQDINALALYLGVLLPQPEFALSEKKRLQDRARILADSPYGYHELNTYEKEALEIANIVLYQPGPAKYHALWLVLSTAFHRKLRWSEHLAESTQLRLQQDEQQSQHLAALKGLESEFENIVPITNYMFIGSSYKEELEAAQLSHINRSSGFALPLFRARRIGADASEPEALIVFSRPEGYEVIEKDDLKTAFETAESRNLLPPGTLHFVLSGTEYKLNSDEDWQWSEILAMIGIGLAVVAAVAAAPFTGGASTAAVPYLTAAAIGVGAASSVFAMKEANDIGELTAGVAMFEIGMIAASIIPLLGTGARIARGTTAYARLGTLGKMTRFVTSAPVQRLGGGFGLFMTTVGAYMFAASLMDQLDAIAEIEDPDEKELALRKLIRFAALTGLMLFVAAKSDFIVARGGVKVGLHSSVKAEYETRQRVNGFVSRIQNARGRYRGKLLSAFHAPLIPLAQYAEIIYYEIRKLGAKISTIRERSAVRALTLTDDEFNRAYKLAEKVDHHLASNPKSIYQGKEEELFGLLMQGKRRFNAKGELEAISPEKIKPGTDSPKSPYKVRNAQLLQQMQGVKQGRVPIHNEDGDIVGQLIFQANSLGRIYVFRVNKGFRQVGVKIKLGSAQITNGVLSLNFNIPMRLKTELNVKGLGALMFDDAFDYLSQRFTTFRALWVKNEKLYKDYGGYSENLTSFREHFSKTRNEIEAAERTFTGRMALKNGFVIKSVNFRDMDAVVVNFVRKP